ncbi:hypothetical protein RJ639_024613 [Escallonia herrerae]|uniref:Reverse transcriptase RNase H-like domain-containing protein n=1 Tax=Escallonia herrerae TaxID=1293975 RepID=A0AA89ABX7_9ASTE|nr:hypothetical protein RJ639_024613 [Escallonia herrerae]
MPKKSLILYIATQEESLSAMLAQDDQDEKEKVLYYLSRRLAKTELKYNPIEKTCATLVFASQKLRHYFFAYTMHLVAKADPIKYVMAKIILSTRLARWSILFNEFDIVYVLRTAIKGQGLANFLIDHPILADWEIFEDFPNEEVFFIKAFQPWMMFFDGAAWSDGVGARALIIGLQMALELGILSLTVSGDSKLIINKLPKEYGVKMEDLVPYFDYATN